MAASTKIRKRKKYFKILSGLRLVNEKHLRMYFKHMPTFTKPTKKP